jgi:hypothetical protein
MSYVGTRTAARQLDAPIYLLYDLLRRDRLTPPAKTEGGDYLWSPEDIERARQALSQRRRRRQETAHES